MDEIAETGALVKYLQSCLQGYSVLQGERLLYKVVAETADWSTFLDGKTQKTSRRTFKTDILIKRSQVPLVVTEVKCHQPTTHDVLTYATKASKHKEFYPYLRYGFAVIGENKIDKGFFMHNSSLDFAMALNGITNGNTELLQLLKKQIHYAEELANIFIGKRSIHKYESIVELL